MTEQVRKEIKKRKEIGNREREKIDLGEVQRTKNKSEKTDKEIKKRDGKIVEEIKQDSGGKELLDKYKKD